LARLFEVSGERTYDGNAVLNIQLAWFGSLTIASSLGRQVNNNGTWLHGRHHGVCDQLWSGFSGNKSLKLSLDSQFAIFSIQAFSVTYGSDHDIDVFALLHEEGHLGFNEFFGHFLSISAATTAFFLDGDF
jgi:hypothetical protein